MYVSSVQPGQEKNLIWILFLKSFFRKHSFCSIYSISTCACVIFSTLLPVYPCNYRDTPQKRTDLHSTDIIYVCQNRNNKLNTPLFIKLRNEKQQKNEYINSIPSTKPSYHNIIPRAFLPISTSQYIIFSTFQ